MGQVPGADLNCGDTDGWTASHAAVYKQQPRCVEELRMAGAGLDWNLEDSHGRRPLTMAVELGLADVLQTSVTDGRGRNVGQIAVESSEGDRQKCVELLCQDRRVDWNVKNRDGDTPVMFCIKQGLTGLARCLINTPQVDLDTVDRDGNYLETVARERDLSILSMVCRANISSIASRLPECPVCYEKFRQSSQVFQCEQGHFVCGRCSSRVQTCPTCRGKIMGRCNGLEQFLQ